MQFWPQATHHTAMETPWKSDPKLSTKPVTSAENTMGIWLQAVHQTCHNFCTSWKHNGNLTPSCSPKLSQVLHKLKTPCSSSTGANMPSPPDKPHGLQANAQRERERDKKRERDIPQMKKNIGILIQSCPPNAPSMETPCKSDSPHQHWCPLIFSNSTPE